MNRLHPKLEELLYVMLWGAERLMRPTYRNVLESFESWAYRRQLLYYIDSLEGRDLIEPKSLDTVERIYRLTEAGRLAALGSRDPESRWNRPWDGKWRAVAFDVPEVKNAARVRLRRYLKDHGFGYLQNSLWISPDPLDKNLKELAARGEDVESFVTLEAMPCSGESNQSLVSGSWDFDQINQLYQECLRLLKNPPLSNSNLGFTPVRVRDWAKEERAAWQAVAKADPFLPSRLLPSGYLGRKVWTLRTKVLRQAGRWLP